MCRERKQTWYEKGSIDVLSTNENKIFTSKSIWGRLSAILIV
jgi:hypothetical protein